MRRNRPGVLLPFLDGATLHALRPNEQSRVETKGKVGFPPLLLVCTPLHAGTPYGPRTSQSVKRLSHLPKPLQAHTAAGPGAGRTAAGRSPSPVRSDQTSCRGRRRVSHEKNGADAWQCSGVLPEPAARSMSECDHANNFARVSGK